MPLDIPLPTASPEDDPAQYIPLLLSAIEGFLLAKDVWEEADYSDARQYMEQLKSYIVELIGDDAMGRPVGKIELWPVATVPDGWLVCDGASLLRTDYPRLFAVLSDDYGSADGTHFSLPDLRSLSPKGAGGAIALGEIAGASSIHLTTGQLPAHNHGVNDPGHIHTKALRSSGVAGGGVNHHAAPTTTTLSSNWQTDTATTGITTADAGSGDAVNIQNPVMGLHYIIYAGE